MIDIRVKRLPHGEGLPLPAYGSDHAVGLDVVAADEADRVRTGVGQEPPDPPVGGVDPQHQVAVLGIRAHQELRRVRARDGGDERHGAKCSAGGPAAQG